MPPLHDPEKNPRSQIQRNHKSRRGSGAARGVRQGDAALRPLGKLAPASQPEYPRYYAERNEKRLARRIMRFGFSPIPLCKLAPASQPEYPRYYAE